MWIEVISSKGKWKGQLWDRDQCLSETGGFESRTKAEEAAEWLRREIEGYHWDREGLVHGRFQLESQATVQTED